MAKGGGKKSAKAQRDAANKLLADNRFARHQYEILETLECGLELFGTEVKSIRAGQSNLRDGFCLIRKGELQLHNVHISPHSLALDQKGLTLIPLNLHLKGSWIKLTIGLAKGRKLHDKRHEERRKQDIKDAKAAIARL